MSHAIIKPSQRIHHEEWSFYFEYIGERGSGYSFPCDEQGNIFMDQLQPEGLESLKHCLDGSALVRPGIVEKYEWDYIDPAILRCDCGQEVTLDSTWANTCNCGREYSFTGQLLAPRSQWGEEFSDPNDADPFGPDPEDIRIY